MTFKSRARQVWMANLIAKQRTTETTSKTHQGTNEKRDNIPLSTNGIPRPPSVKRRGTPEIFPMSSEMKKTLLMLGNLDLLPLEERPHEQITTSEGETKSSLSKFRLKTKQKIIQPQRFLRGVRTGSVKKQSSPVKEETLTDDSIVTTDDLINTKAGSLGESKQENTSIGINKKAFLSEENEDCSMQETYRKRQMKTARVVSSANFPSVKRDAWSKSFQKYQAVYAIANSPIKANRRFDSKRTRKIHLSSKTWQPETDFQLIPVLPMRRAISMGIENTTSPEYDSIDNVDIMRDGKTIDEITTDIQLRCSKWFEFRQKILKQRYMKQRRQSCV